MKKQKRFDMMTLAIETTRLEGGKVNCTIAQVLEVLSCAVKVCKAEPRFFVALVRKVVCR